MNLETFLLAAIFGALGGALLNIRTWASVVADIRHHGFDNHCDYGLVVCFLVAIAAIVLVMVPR